jgi:hypothetical protein
MLNYNDFIKMNENNDQKRVFSFDVWKKANGDIKNFIKSLYEKIKSNRKLSEEIGVKLHGDVERDMALIYERFLKFKDEANYLRKEQKYYPMFFRFFLLEKVGHQELEDLYKRILNHKNTINQWKIDLSELENVEAVNDRLDEIKDIEKANKFIKLIPNPLRNKIKGDPDNIEKLSNLIIGYSYEDYSRSFIKNISAIRNEEPWAYFKMLKNHIESFGDKGEIYEKVENDPGMEIVHSTDDYLLVRVYSKKASCEHGSSRWCISNPAMNYWSKYIAEIPGMGSKEKPGVQYFVWDFRYGQSDRGHRIGVTKYRNGESDAAHFKDDTGATGYVSHQPWYRYMVDFDQLNKKQQIKLVAENPEMESYTGVINSLSDKEKRKMLNEVPKLLTQFRDLSFLTNEEIWSLVKKDFSLSDNFAIAKELTEEQKIISVIKNPDVLEKTDKYGEKNPYKEILPLLTSRQKVEMISNKHSLYKQFRDILNEDDLIDLVKMDPTIMVSYTDITNNINNRKLGQIYHKDQRRWDAKIRNASNKENSSKIEILLKHLLKDEKRIQMEKTNKCYVYVAYEQEINGEKWLLPLKEEGLLLVGDILDPQNQQVPNLMLMADTDDDLESYFSFISMENLPLDKLDGDLYFFEGSDYETIIKEGGREKAILEQIRKKHFKI